LLQSLQTRRLYSLIWPSTGPNRAPNALAEMNRGLERGDAFDLAAYSSSFDSPPGEEAAKNMPSSTAKFFNYELAPSDPILLVWLKNHSILLL